MRRGVPVVAARLEPHDRHPSTSTHARRGDRGCGDVGVMERSFAQSFALALHSGRPSAGSPLAPKGA